MLIISFLKSICQSINPSIIHPFGDSFYILHYKFNIINKMKTTMPLIILIIQTLLFITSCKQTTEPKLEALLKLELEDASCTEAWIRLTTTNLQFPATINLLKNGNVAQTISLWRDADTVLYVDSLLPSQTYRFKSIVQSSNHQIRSNELSVTTMDTTSHEFIWQSWEFGTIGSSTLYDVAIIDENDIWAVGEINIADTSINGYTTYNAVHWDGTKWELKRIPSIICGSTNIIYSTIYTIYLFNKNDIIFSDGAEIIHFNGEIFRQDCSINSLLTGKVNKLWGSSSEDLYAVGNNGNIAHWDGRKWTKIESGTDLNIGTIWGVSDDKGGYNKYLAAGEAMIILNNDNKVNIIYPEPNMYINSLWAITNNLIFTAGNGVVLFKNNKWEKIDRPELNTVYSIKGNNFNNVFGISAVSSVIHFNGFNWQFINKGDTKIYFRIEIKNDLTAAVGWQGDRAALTLLRRIN